MPRSLSAQESLRPRLGLAASLAVLGLAARAGAQTPPFLTYSVEWHGPTVGALSSTPGIPITEADILVPPLGTPAFGPLARPGIFRTGGQLGLTLYPGCVGHTGGTDCHIEVDAISFGNDSEFKNPPSLLLQATRLYFSVDEQAVGHVGNTIAPGVRSEATPAQKDHSADVFCALNLPAGPLAPGAVPPQNVGVLDGNGLVSATGHVYRGIGILEPNGSGPPPDMGDNLDALHLRPPPAAVNASIYYSLAAGFVDPVLGIPNSNSGQLQGFPGASVLRGPIAGGTPTLYAAPAQLGLDLLGIGSDDLDALILQDNGDAVFQPSLAPYDWVGPGGFGGPRDMLLFSVRRGSALIGVPDSIFGLPIVPGDILTTPLGGVGTPGIFIAAENLGLEADRTPPGFGGDELDAAAAEREPYFDCNNNGVEDSVDIATGASADANNNGIPDECEDEWQRYCECTSGNGPCGNDYATGGCANSTAVGSTLDGSGSTSYAMDDLVLTVAQLPANKTGLWLTSLGQMQTPLGDGLRCVGNPFYRFGSFNSGAGGTGSKGPGIIASSCATLPPAGCIAPGSTWNFQVWNRDPTGPCGNGTNLSNGLQVTITP